jgi:hypothetical protein
MTAYVNLLPLSYRRRRFAARRLRQWLVAWGGVAAGCIVVWWWSAASLQSAAAARDKRITEYAPILALAEDTQRMEREIKELEVREAMLAELHEEHPPLAGLGYVSNSARLCEGRIRVQRMALEGRSAPVKGIGKGAPRDANSSIVVEGTGLDNLAVARFVLALKECEAFQAVELKSSVETRISNEMVRRFVIECEY